MKQDQESSVAFARAVREHLRDDEHYQCPADQWETVVVDLIDLLDQARIPSGDPVEAVPGTLRALLYELQGSALRYPEHLDGEVIVSSGAGIGERPIHEVDVCNGTTNLIVDGEFWDPEIHPGLLIQLSDESVQAILTPQQIEQLGELHDRALAVETGRYLPEDN